MDTKTSPIALLNDPTLLKTDALINGQWVRGSQRFAVHDPATGAKLADVANLGPQEAQAAIDAAQAAGEPEGRREVRAVGEGRAQAGRYVALCEF